MTRMALTFDEMVRELRSGMVARRSLPFAIEDVKRSANARGDWNADQLATLPVDARSAGEFDRGAASAERKEWIEALGDSNPPHMAEAIGRALVAASMTSGQGGGRERR